MRTAFAQRLKDERIKRGYPKARSFARAIGIEENRYVRYERAEAEPTLALITRICEVLDVTPDHLLGFAHRGGLETGRSTFNDSLRDESAHLLLLLKQARDHLGECVDIMSLRAQRE